MVKEDLILIALFLLTAVSIRQIRRTIKVGRFRMRILDMVHDWNMKLITSLTQMNETAYRWVWDTLPSFWQMTISFKPLTLENWLTQEQIEKLKS